MSEPKQQPKILMHKPKKSQRTPPGVSPVDDRGVSTASKTPPPPPPPPPVPKAPIWYRFRTALTTLLVLNAVLVGYTLFRTNFKSVEPFESDPEKKDEGSKDKAKETEKESEKPEIVDTKGATPEVTESEVSDASKSAVPESPKEKAKETKKESEKPEIVDTKGATSEVTESEVSDASKSAVPESPKATVAAVLPPKPVVQAVNKPKPSGAEQQELYKWMLAEKRKIKPATKAEKAQIDAEKALLKEYLRGKNALSL